MHHLSSYYKSFNTKENNTSAKISQNTKSLEYHFNMAIAKWSLSELHMPIYSTVKDFPPAIAVK